MRTYLTSNNSRGKEVTAGNPTYAHLRGWHAGVRVQVSQDSEGRDEFHVFSTAGSAGHGGDVLLGTVSDTSEGPAWKPEGPERKGLAPAGLGVYSDGELLFSADAGKWETIGPALKGG